jgi:hypothetical protein
MWIDVHELEYTYHKHTRDNDNSTVVGVPVIASPGSTKRQPELEMHGSLSSILTLR